MGRREEDDKGEKLKVRRKNERMRRRK